jgi:transposase-like protein
MAATKDAPSTECSELIRTGRDGRQRYSEEYKRQVLDAFEASGMSGKAFAEQCGVKYPTFASWLAKRRRDGDSSGRGTTDPGTPAFLLAEIGEGFDALELTLPGGITARVTTPGQARLLAALVAALR